MAIFCLAKDLEDLKERLGNIIVAYTRDRKPIRARDLKAHGAMTVLLKDALAPNLVQTLEGTPAFIHGGPFANIAHGCNSVLGNDDRAEARRLRGDRSRLRRRPRRREVPRHQVPQGRPEAGLRRSSSPPSARSRCTAASRRKTSRRKTSRRSKPAWRTCSATSRTCKKFGLPAVVSINRFSADTDAEIALVKEKCKALGVEALMADHWAMGGEGAADVARAVVKICDEGKSKLKLLYPDDMPLFEKIRTIAKEIYRAEDVDRRQVGARTSSRPWEEMGFGKLPVCIAKTQYSLLDQPGRQGRADRLHHPGARGAALGRRRVRRGDLR